MSNLRIHAERELKVIGMDPDGPKGDMNTEMAGAILQLIDVFSAQGHSGMSAPYCLQIFNKVAAFEPLAPLTGEDDEWNDVGDDMKQNIRCSHVFKSAGRFDGQAYDSQGRVFKQADGSCHTSSESFTPITFPYAPKVEYVDVK